VDRLLELHTDKETARILDERGYRTGVGQRPHRVAVRRIREAYGLPSYYQRLRAKGFLTRQELAQKLGVCPATVNVWRRAGLIQGVPADDRGECLYKGLEGPAPARYKWKGITRRLRERRNRREQAAGGAV
jgi:hypothetical protein